MLSAPAQPKAFALGVYGGKGGGGVPLSVAAIDWLPKMNNFRNG